MGKNTTKINQDEITQRLDNFILHGFGPDSNELKYYQELRSAELINRPSSIDNRKILSATPGSRSGINYDSNSETDHLLLLTDRNGNEHPMKLDKHNTAQLISYLQSLKFE